MMENIIEKIRKNMGIITAAFLWLCVWSTYNTDITRVLAPGFPHNAIDLIHGIRSFIPFLALIFAGIILIKRYKLKLFKFPLVLFMIYAIIGIISSFMSKNPMLALYWGVLYFTVIAVLFAVESYSEGGKNVSIIIWINFIIASFLAISLTVIFFLKPGVFSLETIKQFLQGFRPYEGIGNITVDGNIFGMTGTRPTGLGRYAAIAAIISFAQLWRIKEKTNIIYIGLSCVFTAILIFSRARTSVIAFLFAIFFITIFMVKQKGRFISILFSVLLLLSLTNFYNYFWLYLVPESSLSIQEDNKILSPTTNTPSPTTNTPSPTTNTPSPTTTIPQNNGFPDNHISTLSGRTFIWYKTWNVFLTSPLIGRGFQADRIFLDGLHAHDTWLQTLIQSGALGLLFFGSGFMMFIFFLLRRLKNDSGDIILIWCLGILVFFTIRSITESFAFFGADWLMLAPFIAYLSFKKPGEEIGSQSIVTILGKKINVMAMPEVLERIKYWIKNEPQKNHWIVVCGMHGIVEGYKDPKFKDIINSADLSLIDGMSLVFLGKLMGIKIQERIAGPDLMKEYFKFAEKQGFATFFLGDTDDTLEKLMNKTLLDFPNLKIIGSYSPPFKDFTEDDNKKIIEIINQKKPDVLLVALSLKKQESWIYNSRHKIEVPVIIGVGAAFKFLSDKVKRAPQWMRSMGFEWLWRLSQEPKVIWKRVFLDGPLFIWIIVKYFSNYIFIKLNSQVNRAKAKRILLFIEKYFLWVIGVFTGHRLLRELIPYDVNGFNEKIRLGNLSDGGYVVPTKILPLIDVEYCYGVADHIDFEEDLIKHINVPVRFYDHTVEALPVNNRNFFFKKQGIARYKNGKFDTMHNHLRENGDLAKKIILKIDIEGDEWNVISDIIENLSENIIIIILEIHRLYRYEKSMKYTDILKKINSKFTLVHLHGNNNGETVSFGGKKIPSVLELTFINNSLVTDKKVMTSYLPSNKDYPNIKGREDVILDFWEK